MVHVRRLGQPGDAKRARFARSGYPTAASGGPTLIVAGSEVQRKARGGESWRVPARAKRTQHVRSGRHQSCRRYRAYCLRHGGIVPILLVRDNLAAPKPQPATYKVHRPSIQAGLRHRMQFGLARVCAQLVIDRSEVGVCGWQEQRCRALSSEPRSRPAPLCSRRDATPRW